ncbi:MAG: hypothetical protein PHS96_05035 [Anaerolineales bacterium]|nr:hypothetical protein [Anaerolineales bacterium]
MAKAKFDVVIEAVHQKSSREIAWVRAYERRGPTFSDHVLLSRQEVVDRLKQGKKIVVGKRLPQLASTFEVTHPVRLAGEPGAEALVVGEGDAEHDRMDGVPLI